MPRARYSWSLSLFRFRIPPSKHNCTCHWVISWLLGKFWGKNSISWWVKCQNYTRWELSLHRTQGSDTIRLHHLFKYEHYRGDSVVKGKEERLFTNYVYILVWTSLQIKTHTCCCWMWPGICNIYGWIECIEYRQLLTIDIKTAFTINGTYETKPEMKTKPNSNRTQQLLFTFLQGIIFLLD